MCGCSIQDWLLSPCTGLSLLCPVGVIMKQQLNGSESACLKLTMVVMQQKERAKYHPVQFVSQIAVAKICIA